MRVWQQVRLGRRVSLGLPLGAALIALTWGLGSPGPAQAEGTGARLALNAQGAGVSCDEASEPSACVVPLAGPFTLAVELIDPPSDGYVAFQSQVSLGGLVWSPRASADENVWPDNTVPVRAPDPPELNAQVVSHGGLTGTSEPFPVSHHEGNVVEMTLTCSAEEESFEVALINYSDATPNGAAYSLADLLPIASKTVDERELDAVGSGTPTTVSVAGLLEINCEEVPPTPTEGPATTATPILPTTGYGGGADRRGGESWLIVGLLVSSAAVLGFSGWRFARRSN